MGIITQDAYHRQRMIQYAKEYGVTEAAIRFRTSRKTVYKWLGRYDGSIDSLRDRSHRPHSHPKAHTEEEKAMILRVAKRNNRKDVLLIYEKLLKKGYSRSSRLSGTKGTSGRKVCAESLRIGWEEVLPVHSQRRVQPLDIPGYVRRMQHLQRQRLP